MRIVVPVKYVPDPTYPRQFAADNTLERADDWSHLSELDEYAVEQAVRLVEGGIEATVVFVTMGPSGAVDALRKALAIGGDEAIHVEDEALRGSDSLATSLVLAKAIERTGFDLVVCGMASTDGEMSVVPAMLAERLGVPQATFAASLSVVDGSVRVTREGDQATEELTATLPAVVSVTDRTGEARYPSFKAIMTSKRKPVTTWSLADLGIDSGAVGWQGAASLVRSAAEQPPRSAGEVVVDEGDGASRIVDFLVARKVV